MTKNFNKVIQSALTFMKTLDLNSIYFPCATFNEEEFSIYWELKRIKLFVGFEEEDEGYSYYAKMENGTEYYGDNIPPEIALPDALVDMLKKKD